MNRKPSRWARWLRRKELQQLRIAAVQIGNPLQYVQWGDVLRETGDIEAATQAYQQALSKEPGNLAALWGAALCACEREEFTIARSHLAAILAEAPEYKFGDVSLLYARCLQNTGELATAAEYWQATANRWRHPEAVFRWAEIQYRAGEIESAKSLLEGLLVDIESNPRRIRKRAAVWQKQSRQLLKTIAREQAGR